MGSNKKIGFVNGSHIRSKMWRELCSNTFIENNMTHTEIAKFTGNNTGNITHRYAACNLFAEGIEFVNYEMTAEEVNDKCKMLVMPVANLLDGKDQSWIYHLLTFTRNCKLPCLLMGVGAQSGLDLSIPEIDIKLIKFFKEFTNDGNHVTIRGEFTRKVLEHYGVTKNIHLTGCQSLFLNGHTQLGKIIQGKLNNTDTDMIYFNQFSYETELNKVFDVLSRESKYVLVNGCDNLMVNIKNKSMNAIDGVSLPSDILEKSKIFVSPIKQAEFLRQQNAFVLTPRIHGAMISISAELPALCIAHDSRVKELCETHKIPHCDIKTLLNNPSNSLFSSEHYGEDFDANRQKLSKVYHNLFKKVGVTPSKKLFGK